MLKKGSSPGLAERGPPWHLYGNLSPVLAFWSPRFGWCSFLRLPRPRDGGHPAIECRIISGDGFRPPVQFVISRLRARSSRVVRLIPPGLINPRLATLRAWRFDQVHGEISVVQLGDEVGGDCLPGAGFGAPDPIVVSTILHTGNVTFVGHHRA